MPPINPTTNASKPKRDQSNRSLYDASYSEIVFKNFLAGLFRGLGSLLIWVLFFGIATQIFISIMMPKLQPILDSYQQALNSINQMNQTREDIENTINQNPLNQLFRGNP